MMDATGIENRIALCEHLERAAERATSDRRLADAALLRAAAVQIRYDGGLWTGAPLPPVPAVASSSIAAPSASSSAAPTASAPGAPPPRKRGRPKQQAEIPGTAQQAGAPPVPVQP